jgi:hypothetical protein
MPKVSVLLEDGENELTADAVLRKAIDFHLKGDVHARESFEDPAMVDAGAKFETIHSEAYDKMVAEIIETLESEYGNVK